MPTITPEVARSTAMIIYQLWGSNALDEEGEYDLDLQDDEHQHRIIREMINAGIYPVDQWAEEMRLDIEAAQHRLCDSFFVEDFMDNLFEFIGFELQQALYDAVPAYINRINDAYEQDVAHNREVEAQLWGKAG